MELIETDKGLINAAHVAQVKRIYPDKGSAGQYRLFDAEGRSLGQTKEPNSEFDFVQIESTLVSAPPGFSVVRIYDDEEAACWEEPIIAFYVGKFGAHPVTVEGPIGNEIDAYGIKQPNGKILICALAEFSTLEDFRTYALKERARHAKLAAAKRAQQTPLKVIET